MYQNFEGIFSVKINNDDRFYYYLEERVNQEFFSDRELENIIVNKDKSDKTFILNCVSYEGRNLEYVKYINELKQRIKNSKLSEPLKKEYIKLNNFIGDLKYDSLQKVH